MMTNTNKNVNHIDNNVFEFLSQNFMKVKVILTN